jgi:hypothetical protein
MKKLYYLATAMVFVIGGAVRSQDGSLVPRGSLGSGANLGQLLSEAPSNSPLTNGLGQTVRNWTQQGIHGQELADRIHWLQSMRDEERAERLRQFEKRRSARDDSFRRDLREDRQELRDDQRRLRDDQRRLDRDRPDLRNDRSRDRDIREDRRESRNDERRVREDERRVDRDRQDLRRDAAERDRDRDRDNRSRDRDRDDRARDRDRDRDDRSRDHDRNRDDRSRDRDERGTRDHDPRHDRDGHARGDHDPRRDRDDHRHDRDFAGKDRDFHGGHDQRHDHNATQGDFGKHIGAQGGTGHNPALSDGKKGDSHQHVPSPANAKHATPPGKGKGK